MNVNCFKTQKIRGVKNNEFIVFYDWASAKVVRKIELSLKKLYWSSNDMLTLASPDEFYVLQYKKEVKLIILEFYTITA